MVVPEIRKDDIKKRNSHGSAITKKWKLIVLCGEN